MKTLICAGLLACLLNGQTPPADLPKDAGIGVYVKDASGWTAAPANVVRSKPRGILKKRDPNGRIQGPKSRVSIPVDGRIEVLIRTPEGGSGEAYRFLRLGAHGDSSEVRYPIIFHAQSVGPNAWHVVLDGLAQGEYGFMPPIGGKVYAFRIGDVLGNTTHTGKLSWLSSKDAPAMRF